MRAIILRLFLVFYFLAAISLAVLGVPSQGNAQGKISRYLPLLMRRAPMSQDLPLQQYVGLLHMYDGEDDEYYTVRGDGSGWTNITNNTLNDSRGAWSPDGSYLLYKNTSGTWLTTLVNGEAYLVSSLQYEQALWSPNGRYIFLYNDAQLFLLNVSTKELLAGPDDTFVRGGIAWSPTSRHVVWADRTELYGSESRLWVWTIGEQAPHLLITDSYIRVRDWDLNGNRFGFTTSLENDVYEEVDRIYTTDPMGQVITEAIGLSQYRWIGWDKQGNTLLVGKEDQIFRVEQDGSDLSPLTPTNVSLHNVALSPKREYLLYQVAETQYLLHLSESEPISLGAIYCRDVQPDHSCGEGYQWLADGDRFIHAFSTSWRGGSYGGATLGSTLLNPPRYFPVGLPNAHFFSLPFSMNKVAVSAVRGSYPAPYEAWSSILDLESQQMSDIPYEQNGQVYVLEWRYLP